MKDQTGLSVPTEDGETLSTVGSYDHIRIRNLELCSVTASQHTSGLLHHVTRHVKADS
jgi:hypothetical protein